MNLNLKELQESNNYIKSYQENKIEFMDEFLFKLQLHSNLNTQPDFHENSRFSTFLHESHMNVIEFYSMSYHVMPHCIVS